MLLDGHIHSSIVDGAFISDDNYGVGNDDHDVGVCQGINGDDTIKVVVNADNSRLLLDTTRPGFIQSELQCLGKAPQPLHGKSFKCDDDEVRTAWKCSKADFSNPNFVSEWQQMILDKIIKQCHAQPSAPPSVLMMGLGGGIMPTYLESKCPGIKVVTVEHNPNVVAAARDFFAFTGDVVVQDMHVALTDLSKKARHFDFIVADVGHRVVLGKSGMRDAALMLKPNGMVVENLSEPDLRAGQLQAFKAFLGNVHDRQFGQNVIIDGTKVDTPNIASV